MLLATFTSSIRSREAAGSSDRRDTPLMRRTKRGNLFRFGSKLASRLSRLPPVLRLVRSGQRSSVRARGQLYTRFTRDRFSLCRERPPATARDGPTHPKGFFFLVSARRTSSGGSGPHTLLWFLAFSLCEWKLWVGEDFAVCRRFSLCRLKKGKFLPDKKGLIGGGGGGDPLFVGGIEEVWQTLSLSLFTSGREFIFGGRGATLPPPIFVFLFWFERRGRKRKEKRKTKSHPFIFFSILARRKRKKRFGKKGKFF